MYIETVPKHFVEATELEFDIFRTLHLGLSYCNLTSQTLSIHDDGLVARDYPYTMSAWYDYGLDIGFICENINEFKKGLRYVEDDSECRNHCWK